VRHAAVWNGLIRFDLSSVPANVNITSAALSFYVLDRTNASSLEVGLYKLNRNWSEDAATYNLAAAGVPWTVPGAGSDADPDPSAVATLGGVNQTVTFDVTDLVKGWYASPDSNKGALLFGQQADSSVAYTLASSEHNNVIYRPSLQIIFEYQP